MAPTFYHTRGMKVLVNQYNMSPVLNKVEIKNVIEAGDVTSLDDRDRNYVAGLRSGVVSVEGMYDVSTGSTGHATDLAFNDSIGSTAIQVWTVAVRETIGSPCRMLQAHQSAYTVSAPTADVIAVSGEANQSSRMDYGYVLHGGSTARTSTGSFTTVQIAPTTGSGATSTRGGVAHFHLVQQSTITSITVKVQHSSDGSAWADWATFTAATAQTYQRYLSTASLKEKARTQISAFTGGAGKSVKFYVAAGQRRFG